MGGMDTEYVQIGDYPKKWNCRLYFVGGTFIQLCAQQYIMGFAHHGKICDCELGLLKTYDMYLVERAKSHSADSCIKSKQPNFEL